MSPKTEAPSLLRPLLCVVSASVYDGPWAGWLGMPVRKIARRPMAIVATAQLRVQEHAPGTARFQVAAQGKGVAF